jgi:hypothetical protein
MPEGPSADLEAGADDKVFKLSKAPPQICETVEAEARKSAP